MALCRRLPAAALTVVAVALTVHVLRDYPGGPIFLTGWFALRSLSWRRGRRSAVLGTVVLCGALVAASASEGEVAPTAFLVFVGWSAAAVLAGDAWVSAAALRAAAGDLGAGLLWVTGYAVLGTTLGILLRSVPVALAVGIGWAGPFEHHDAWQRRPGDARRSWSGDRFGVDRSPDRQSIR